MLGDDAYEHVKAGIERDGGVAESFRKRGKDIQYHNVGKFLAGDKKVVNSVKKYWGYKEDTESDEWYYQLS